MRLQSAAVVVMVAAPVMAAGQQFFPNLGPPVDPNTRFEVVAIKAFDETVSGQVLMRTTPGRFESSLPVGVLLRQALQKPDYLMIGAPRWIDTTRYSITAKPPENVPPSATSVLLTNLLKDRFQLATHHETRELPIYHLVLARADGRLGPDLKSTSAECQATIAERIAAATAALAGRGGPPPALASLPGPNDPLPCGFVRIPPGLVAGSGRTIAELAAGSLSDLTGRPVIDKTGLTGLYDFTLKYTPDGRVAGPLGSLGPGVGAPARNVDPDVPSLFVALQEQLGLKLESARGAVEVVVIDKIEKPTLD
jgi:uncharacterized protein (TIGR03435 family)